jgi:hypothetical protein
MRTGEGVISAGVLRYNLHRFKSPESGLAGRLPGGEGNTGIL